MVFEKLSKLVAEQFGVSSDSITMETHFINDLSANSIDIVDLMLAVEESFDLDEIEEDALENVKTVGDVVNYISDRI
ncbi:MAG: acyl carrier protein [Clostridiaceae bacterium]|nr:acyl carrier protein [Clostridiaceae bacterium]